MGLDAFSLLRVDTRVQNLEEEMRTLQGKVKNVPGALKSLKETIEKVSNQEEKALKNYSMTLLGKYEKANVDNAEAMNLLVSSLGGTLSAITFKGRKRQVNAGGVRDHRGFMAGTQAVERIFYSLGKLPELSSIISGRIVTACVSSPEDMKSAGLAIAAFYKVLNIFDLVTCPITDRNTLDKMIVVRFEGKYDLKSYVTYSQEQEKRTEIIRGARKNVYILGGNGHGKSSWGNLITGSENFEVGRSDHTTMIPQSCDIETGLGFRIWDTPGLFDGTEQAAFMEDHMNSVIRVNAYASAVLFVFCGSIPASDTTKKTLEYAVKLLGTHVQKQFIAIINDMGPPGMAESRRETYIEMLHECGYATSLDNVLVANAANDTAGIRLIVKDKLAAFKPKLISEYTLKYDRIINHNGNLANAIKEAHESSKRELSDLLRRGKIETIWFRPETPGLLKKGNVSVKPDEIIFRQNSKGYFSRKLGFGTNKVLEERRIKMKGSVTFQTKIRAQLNIEFHISQVGIFLAIILGDPRSILIHTPKGRYDYELRDASQISDEQVRQEIIEVLIDA